LAKSHSCNLSWRSRLPPGSLLRADSQGSLQLLYRRQECSCNKNKSVNDPKFYAKLIPNITRSVCSHAWRGRYQSPRVVSSLAKWRWLFKCAGPIFWCRPVSAYFLSFFMICKCCASVTCVCCEIILLLSLLCLNIILEMPPARSSVNMPRDKTLVGIRCIGCAKNAITCLLPHCRKPHSTAAEVNQNDIFCIFCIYYILYSFYIFGRFIREGGGSYSEMGAHILHILHICTYIFCIFYIFCIYIT
jgi:hypothetical protein